MGLAIRLEDNSGERVLNALKFIDDIVGEPRRIELALSRRELMRAWAMSEAV